MGRYRDCPVGAALGAVLVVLLVLLAMTDHDLRDGMAQEAEAETPPVVDRLTRRAEATGQLSVELWAEPPPAEAPPSAQAPAEAVVAAAPAASAPAAAEEVAGRPAQEGHLDPGTFPEIFADYQAIGFGRYTRLLSQLGARFFVVRKPAFTIVGEVDATADFAVVGDYELDGGPRLSPRSRDISTEPRLGPVLRRAVEQFGTGKYGVVLLLPLGVERRLMAALQEIGGITDVEIDSFHCVYRLMEGGLVLDVRMIRTTDGRTVTVDRSVDLTAAG